jgi:hypothetical protein
MTHSIWKVAGENYASVCKSAYDADDPQCYGTYDQPTRVIWAKNEKCKEIILGSACAMFNFENEGCHYAQMKLMVNGETEPTLYHISCWVRFVEEW